MKANEKDWNSHDDRQRAESRLFFKWLADGTAIWQLEVRSEYEKCGTYRMGEANFRGSLEGELTCFLTESTFLDKER